MRKVKTCKKSLHWPLLPVSLLLNNWLLNWEHKPRTTVEQEQQQGQLQKKAGPPAGTRARFFSALSRGNTATIFAKTQQRMPIEFDVANDCWEYCWERTFPASFILNSRKIPFKKKKVLLQKFLFQNCLFWHQNSRQNNVGGLMARHDFKPMLLLLACVSHKRVCENHAFYAPPNGEIWLMTPSIVWRKYTVKRLSEYLGNIFHSIQLIFQMSTKIKKIENCKPKLLFPYKLWITWLVY